MKGTSSKFGFALVACAACGPSVTLGVHSEDPSTDSPADTLAKGAQGGAAFDPIAVSVTSRISGVRAEDSVDLAKLSAALERIEPSMLVKPKTDAAQWAPTEREDEHEFWGGETPG